MREPFISIRSIGKSAFGVAMAAIAVWSHSAEAAKPPVTADAVIAATQDCIATTSSAGFDQNELAARGWRLVLQSKDGTEGVWIHSAVGQNGYPAIVAPRQSENRVACIVRDRLADKALFGRVVAALSASFPKAATAEAGTAFVADQHIALASVVKERGKAFLEITVRESGEVK